MASSGNIATYGSSGGQSGPCGEQVGRAEEE
jgi:hypothetical protein